MLRLLLHLSYMCSFLLETGCNNKEYRFDSNLKSKLISNILIYEEGKLVNGRKKKKKRNTEYYDIERLEEWVGR